MLAVLSVSAQTVNIHFQNGTTINFHEDLIESIDFSEKTPEPTLFSGDAVDLGLSVMWASCNLGANSPSEAGGYYAWGETSEKSTYKKENYAYYNSSTTQYTNIGTHISGTEYDAAYVNLGKGWRMPSYDQFRELETKCTWEWVSMNGVLGYTVTGKNGNSIFLPTGGYKSSSGSVVKKNEYGSYWSDLVNNDMSANYFNMSSSTHTVANLFTESKCNGLTIRPIISYDDYNGTSDYDDSAVTSKISAYYGGGSIMSNGNTILSGSKLNFYFKNGSDESVVLTGIQIMDVNGTEGNNLLSSDVTIASGETTGYTITLGKNMTTPKCRFTYLYNKHTYSVEAMYQSFNFAKAKMRELKTE